MFDRITNVYLTSGELNQLISKSKPLGRGTDGTVYPYKNGKLIKIYHKKKSKYNLEQLLNLEMKIYDKNTLIEKKDEIKFNYRHQENDDFITLDSESGLKKALEEREEISLTNLPIGILYVDNKFSGCILKKSRGIQIHYLMGMPIKVKKIILKKVIAAVKELLDHYIYHIDINNSPFQGANYVNESGFLEERGHSHILVNILNPFNIKVNIIDLDGKSAIYTDKEDKKLKGTVETQLCMLLCEFLLSLNYQEISFESEEELDMLRQNLAEINVKYEYIDKLLNNELNLDEMEDVVNSL